MALRGSTIGLGTDIGKGEARNAAPCVSCVILTGPRWICPHSGRLLGWLLAETHPGESQLSWDG